MLPPSLLLFGATPGGREVAPRAAARMGAAFLAEAWLEVREDKLALWEGSGENAHALDGDLEFPVVATVPPGRYTYAVGDDEAEVEVVASTGRVPDFDELGFERDATGRAVVLAPPELAGAAEELAKALGGAAMSPTSFEGLLSTRLAISLGAPLGAVRAQVRVSIGEHADAQSGAHYAVVGKTDVLTQALIAAVGAVERKKPE